MNIEKLKIEIDYYNRIKIYKYKWVYDSEDDLEVKYNENGIVVTECYDCQLEYGSTPDFTLPHWLWELINPSPYKGGGLLCPNCISRRLDHLDLWYNYCSYAIFFQVNSLIRFRRRLFDYWCAVSGPFEDWIWKHYYRDKEVNK